MATILVELVIEL